MTHNGHQKKAGHSPHIQPLITGTAAYFFLSLSLSNAVSAESCSAVQAATVPQSTGYPDISAGKVAMWGFGAKSCQQELAELPGGFKGWFCILSDNRSAVASSVIVYGKWLFWQRNIYPGIASAMVLWRSGIIRSLFKESLKWVMFP